MNQIKKQKLEVPTTLPMTYFYEKHAKSHNRLLIFLHGYTDSAESFLRRAYEAPWLDLDYLAPNGPFPIPVRSEQGFKEAYSWYFEDHSIGRIIIPKQVAIDMLKNLLSQLGLENCQKIIVGFSQGGFLAPKLAEELTHVEKIIGIGCLYRKESYEKIKHVQVYGIHGTEDTIVPFQEAQKTYQDLTAEGFKGEFASFEGLGHTINNEARAKLKEFIA